MKAFVIKNKEGKYFQWLFNHEPDWEDELYNGFMHYSKKDAEKSIIDWQLKDCEVVPVTVAEGDWKQKNKQLKEQLKEKDKEIERLKKNMEFDTAYHIKELVNVRKQVCDEIRKEFGYKYNNQLVVSSARLMEFLDEIEKGERVWQDQ